jgi:plasmid maintenance system killer protein
MTFQECFNRRSFSLSQKRTQNEQPGRRHATLTFGANWRIVFRLEEAAAFDVELTDCH